MISLHQFRPFPPSKWLIITFFLAITLNLPICYSISTLKWYNSCGNYFNCGNVTNVGFPFWGGGSRPKNCGYSELQLSCENNVTKIEIMGMKYNVLDLNENTKIARLAREDFVQGICLHQFINTTLDFKLFDYAFGSQNVTVLYGCPPPYAPVSSQFTCRISGTNDTTGYPELGALGPSGCSESVVVPVLGSLAPRIGGRKLTLDQILRQGFETTYKVEDQTFCTECEKSNGRCGFDLNKNKTSCLCLDGSAAGHTTCTNGSTLKKTRRIAGVALTKPKFVIALTASVLAIGTGMFIVLVFCLKRCCLSHNRVFVIFHPKKQQEVEAFLRNFGSPGLKRYTYTELKRITNSYKDKLGEGGYGAVYKGRLLNGDLVAVKLLKKPKGDAEEFINEVASIGKTNHVNIVTLLGFCYEGHKRALVYEFMLNGSLEKFIQGTDKALAWDKLFQIFVGIARGLEYLHRGCNTRILHFDIKPHNILLDENFCPKISDFGLAKSCPLKESIISMSIARGTVGYIAPEVFLKSFGGVSQKSDVYSYGMLVLEMVGCREIPHDKIECSSDQYFPHWIYKQLDTGNKLDDLEILSDEERELQRKMVLVSLWCIQPHPSSRPTMTRVVEMLQGTLESVPIPPIPSVASPPRSHQVYSTTTTLLIS